MSKDT
jgi:hypothetical protein